MNNRIKLSTVTTYKFGGYCHNFYELNTQDDLNRIETLTNFKKIFNNDNPIQLIVPPKRIQFQKLVNGKRPENFKNACNFDCFYYCWKMNLPKDFIHL